jgi:CubicO group peptidase (beta-lactamase class C family)
MIGRTSIWILAFALVVVLATGCAPSDTPPALVATNSTTVKEAGAATPQAASAAPVARTPWPIVAAPDYWTTDGWRAAAPEAEGMSSARLAQVFDTIREQKSAFHSLLIVRHGYLVAEAYFHPYTAGERHDQWSVTKSFTGALIGIAIADGRIKGTGERVLDFFPERTIAQRDARKEAMTLESLLTMTSGLQWPEITYTPDDGQPPIDRMVASRDWVGFVLDQPMALPPGQTWNYNSGASHVLSAILQAATGQTGRQYAQTKLFDPLGISDVVWWSDPQSVTVGGWGLQIVPRDMAKLGLLYLQGGAWDGRQIVPATWVADSTTARADTKEGHGYGYQWWLYDFGAYAAQGRYGQFIMVVPAQDLVVVVTADLGDDAPTRLPNLVRDVIIPSAHGPGPLPADPAGAARLAEAIRLATE